MAISVKKRLNGMNKNSLRADKHFIVDTQQDHMFAQNQCKKKKKKASLRSFENSNQYNS